MKQFFKKYENFYYTCQCTMCTGTRYVVNIYFFKNIPYGIYIWGPIYTLKHGITHVFMTHGSIKGISLCTCYTFVTSSISSIISCSPPNSHGKGHSESSSIKNLPQCLQHVKVNIVPVFTFHCLFLSISA